MRAGDVAHHVEAAEHFADQHARPASADARSDRGSSAEKAEGDHDLPIVIRPPSQIARATTYT